MLILVAPGTGSSTRALAKAASEQSPSTHCSHSGKSGHSRQPLGPDVIDERLCACNVCGVSAVLSPYLLKQLLPERVVGFAPRSVV